MKGSYEKLGSLAKIKTGKLDANASSSDGKYPFFTCARAPLKISSYTYDCECVLVAGNGDLNVKYFNGKFDAYQRTYIVESKDKNRLDVRYLYHFLDTYLVKLREQSIGGIIKYIKLGNLTEAIISFPPLPEQKRIAAILDKADALRYKRRESITKLDELLQSVFLDMFGDPVTNPKGPVGSLEEFCKKITDGTHISPRWATQGVPFLFVSNIKNCEINFDTKKFISDEEYNRLTKNNPIEKGDILYTVVGSYGNPAMIRDDRKFAFQRHIAHLRPKKAMSSEYLESMLNTKAILQQVDQVVTGIAQKTLILRALRKLKIIIPTYDQQINFTKQKEAIMKQLSLQKAMYYQCEIFFSSLQQRAFKGEL